MALQPGDPVLLTSTWAQNGAGTPMVLSSGSGPFSAFGAGESAVLLNSGVAFDGNTVLLLEVAPGTSGLFGKCVQVTGSSPVFRGAVIAELQIEVGTTGGTGTLTEFVLVQSVDGFRFLATAGSVEEVPC